MMMSNSLVLGDQSTIYSRCRSQTVN